MPQNPDVKEKPVFSVDVMQLIRILSKLINEVGFTGFAVITFTIYLFFFVSPVKRDEFFDTWILFKTGNNHYFLFVILALFVAIIAQHIHYRSKVRMLKQRINEIASEKKDLQSMLAPGMDLGTSNNNAK